MSSETTNDIIGCVSWTLRKKKKHITRYNLLKKNTMLNLSNETNTKYSSNILFHARYLQGFVDQCIKIVWPDPHVSVCRQNRVVIQYMQSNNTHTFPWLKNVPIQILWKQKNNIYKDEDIVVLLLHSAWNFPISSKKI